MEVQEAKKTFLIFLISAYVNLGARILEAMLFKKHVFPHDLDLAAQ